MHSKKIRSDTSKYCPSVAKIYVCRSVVWRKPLESSSPKSRATTNHQLRYCPIMYLNPPWREIPQHLWTPALPTDNFHISCFLEFPKVQTETLAFGHCPLFYFLLRRVWVHHFCSNPSLLVLLLWHVLSWFAFHLRLYNFLCLFVVSHLKVLFPGIITFWILCPILHSLKWKSIIFPLILWCFYDIIPSSAWIMRHLRHWLKFTEIWWERSLTLIQFQLQLLNTLHSSKAPHRYYEP